MRILVTGGAGYIGSHTCIELLNSGHEVWVVDNLCNSKEEVLKRIKYLTSRKVNFVKTDLRDASGLTRLFEDNSFDAVIHFAGLKAVGESVADPVTYYDNNLIGTLNLISAMVKSKVKKLIFSSSATVYGDPKAVPITEEFPTSATNPYGRSKLFIEEILRDLFHSKQGLSIAILRYFNPVGAHNSGLIGEDPKGMPNNLMPVITKVALGKIKRLKVYGDDYPTPDGTGVRDYIHVVDLARGHLSALGYIFKHESLSIFNLGTGRGYSVFEVMDAFTRITGRTIPYDIVGRRAGDVPICYADPTLAKSKLQWVARLGLDEMIADVWRWQSGNPDGYGD